MTETHRFGDGRLSATVAAHGAELRSVSDDRGREWLWQGGPAWPRRAPLLFPIVGRLPGDTLRHEGRAHRLTQHGFARDLVFDWLRREPDGCALRLSDSAATREAYPFAFELVAEWRIADGALTNTVRVTNPGPGVLPFSLGAHPAFAWPLPGAEGRPHGVTFPGHTHLSAHRLEGGLLNGAQEMELVEGRLALSPALFEADAIVLPAFGARQLVYGAEGGPSLTMEWSGYPDFGLWSKPGAPFLCLEPWNGTTPPLGWDGEISDKPGIIRLPEGETELFAWAIAPRT